MPRTAGIDIDIRVPDPEVKLGIGPEALARLAGRVLSRSGEPDLDHLDLDLPSVPAAIKDLRARLQAELEGDFDDFTEHLTRTVEIAAYFLATLSEGFESGIDWHTFGRGSGGVFRGTSFDDGTGNIVTLPGSGV